MYYGIASRACDKTPEDEQFIYSGPQADEGASPIVIFIEDFEDASLPSYSLSNLSSDLGVNYVFAVTAFNSAGESPYAFEAQFEDVAPPVICDASTATETQVILDFTEFVEVASTNYRLVDESDNEIIINSVTYDNVSFKNVTLNTEALTEGRRYTLTAQDVKDFFSGNIMKEMTLDFVYTNAPHVKKVFVLNGRDGIRVSFSEKTTLGTSSISSNYLLDNTLYVNSATPADEGKNVEVFTTAAFLEGSDYNLTVTNITDLFENTLPDNSLFSFSHAFDLITPLVLSAHVANPSKNDAKVYVVFSEEMNKISAETAEIYVINNEIIINAAALQLDGRTVILTTSPHMDSDYTVTVSNVTDDAIGSNAIETSDLSYKVLGASFVQPLLSEPMAENKRKTMGRIRTPATPKQLQIGHQ